MNGSESEATRLYNRACEGDVNAQCEMAEQLLDLAPLDERVLAVADQWAQLAMQTNPIAGGFGLTQVRWRRGIVAHHSGKPQVAIDHFAAVVALLDGIADEGEGRAADIIPSTLAILPDGVSEASVVDRARAVRREAMSHGE